MKQILFFDWLPERTSLRHRRNVTLVKSVCETAPQSMLSASICILGFGMHPEWPAVPDPDFEIREGAGGCGGRFPPKIFVWSKNKGGPGSIPWICHYPVRRRPRTRISALLRRRYWRGFSYICDAALSRQHRPIFHPRELPR